MTNITDLLNPQRLNDFIFIIKEARTFIKHAYLSDMKLLATKYNDSIKAKEGDAFGNFLAVGGYGLFEGGVIYDHDYTNIHAFDETYITEEVTKSWYNDEGKPEYTDFGEDGTLREEKYS